MNDEPFFLGIDGGGSTTAAVLMDNSGVFVGRGEGGPSNAYHNPWPAILASIAHAVDGCIQDANGARPLAAVVNVPWIGDVLGLLHELLPGCHILRGGERTLAFAACGLYAEVGVVIVAGTGSSVQGINASGKSLFIGGWGSVLGDEGSAYHIAVRAINRALKALDGRADPSLLVDRMMATFGAGQDAQVCAKTIGKYSREIIAAFSRQVDMAAQMNDPAACAILADAGFSLAEDACYVGRNLFEESQRYPILPAGGVFRSQAVVDALKCRVQELQPNAQILIPDTLPAEGAAKLARYRYNASIESGVPLPPPIADA